MNLGPFEAHETTRVLSEKTEREVPAPRPYFRRSTSVGLSANHRPLAEHWRFALDLKCDCSAVNRKRSHSDRLFFRWHLSRTRRIELRSLPPRPGSEARQHYRAQRSKIVGFPARGRGSRRRGGTDGYSEACIERK